jgi:hypothetical protein
VTERLIALIIFAVLIVIPAGITLSKRQWVEFLIGFLLPGIVWMIASCRLARPSSWWARHFYGQEKMQRALNRFDSGASRAS